MPFVEVREWALELVGANSLNAIKILANSLIAIDPTYYRHKKIPSMPFSGIQGIGENFNGIQGINSLRIYLVFYVWNLEHRV